MFLDFAWNIYISLEAAVAPVFDMNLGLKISNCTMLMASSAVDVSGAILQRGSIVRENDK